MIKSPCCKHENGCILHILDGAARSFGMIFALKSVIALLLLCLNYKRIKNAKKFLTTIFSAQNFSFALFPCIFTIISKVVLCFLRFITKNDNGINSMASGAIAGFFSLFIVEKSSRATWALYLLSRSLDGFYNSMVNRGVIKASNVYSYILIWLCNSVLGPIAWTGVPFALPTSLVKFYDNVSDFKPWEQLSMEVWRYNTQKSFGIDRWHYLNYLQSHPTFYF